MSFHISPTPDLRPDTSSSSQSFPAVDDLAALFDMPDTPISHPHSQSHMLTSPDDLFSAAASLNWTTTLETMPAAGSDDSSPTDFAFEPPPMSESAYPTSKTPTFGNASSYSAYPTYAPYGSFSASSFSSAASGSAGGSSFSSADALPAISRDFSRPSPTETRRPATAGGALQRSDYGTFQRLDIEDDKPEPIEENAESMFSNPFGSPKDDRQLPAQDGVDPRFLPQSRRASEGGFNMQPPSWPGNQYQMQSSAPPNVTQFNVLQQMHMQRPNSVTARPQTSDGLPTYHGVGTHVSLPSARTIVNQIDSQGSYYSPGLAPPAQIRSYDDKTVSTSSLMPFRDSTMPDAPPTGRFSLDAQKPLVRPSYMPAKAETKPNGELTFVPLGGPAPRKRPRRRFDEIERLYQCGWNGCEKAYGTLNHLNAHVAMQKHGEKRLPAGKRVSPVSRDLTPADHARRVQGHAQGLAQEEARGRCCCCKRPIHGQRWVEPRLARVLLLGERLRPSRFDGIHDVGVIRVPRLGLLVGLSTQHVLFRRLVD